MKKYKTIRREAITEILNNAERPLNVSEITERVKSRTGFDVTRQTVLKVLGLLSANSGPIREIATLGGSACYARQDAAYGPVMYQVGPSIYQEPPEGFKADYTVEITVGRIE